jgi:hypothetical protein
MHTQRSEGTAMTMQDTPPPPPADNAIARTARVVGATVASLLVMGLVDGSAWNLVMGDSQYSTAAPIVVRAWEALAVLLTLPALVWVIRLFIAALRSSMPRALIALVAVTAASVLGPSLWHAMTGPSPRAQALAMVHVLQPCVRSTEAYRSSLALSRAVAPLPVPSQINMPSAARHGADWAPNLALTPRHAARGLGPWKSSIRRVAMTAIGPKM